MGGRVRWQRDGKTVVGYRKTNRRQGPRRSTLDRLADLNRQTLKPRVPGDPHEVRLAFLLPASLQGLVASGAHGIGVTVLAKGFVQVIGHSAEQCCMLARAFLADVAAERPAFTALASILGSQEPDHPYGRHLTVVSGSLIVSGGSVEPKVYEA